MVWREQNNHFDDCYFCIVNIISINRNNRDKWSYPELPSARRSVPHSDLVPVPPFVNCHSSERSRARLLLHNVKKMWAVTVIFKQLHIVNVLTRINCVI
jgi:hypothetical protein